MVYFPQFSDIIPTRFNIQNIQIFVYLTQALWQINLTHSYRIKVQKTRINCEEF